MERIIFGTGRCGSTLLSNLMSLHSQALVLSEFFMALDPPRGWPYDRDISADKFIDILRREDGISPVWMAHDRSIGEVLVDLEAEKQKKQGFLNRPTLLFIALRFLSEDPEALLQEIIATARLFPRQSLRAHFLSLIDWLMNKYEKRFWIERSGMSTNILRHLRRTFPDAKFVHIHRDGPETALSVRTHASASLIASFHLDPPTDEELQRSLDLSIPSQENPMIRRLDNPLPPERFGEYWSYSLAMAYREMPYLRPEQLHEVRFEDLIERPREVLGGIATFFELPRDETWIDRAARQVTNVPSRADKLSPEARERLEQACRPGRILVGRDDGKSPADAANAKLAGWLQHLSKT